ncbi:MAG: DUF5615 family PIN-like protein [Anaerolineae bacterium]
MNLVADEGVDRQIVAGLRALGHEVVYIAEVTPSVADEDVLRLANEQHAILITADKDFGELVYRLRQVAEGVVPLRLAGVEPETKAQIVARVFRDYGDEMQNAFTVISPGRLRIRPAQQS